MAASTTTPRRLPPAPARLDYWSNCLDPLGELDEETRTLLASRARQRWMALVGRMGAQARRDRPAP